MEVSLRDIFNGSGYMEVDSRAMIWNSKVIEGNLKEKGKNQTQSFAKLDAKFREGKKMTTKDTKEYAKCTRLNFTKV